MDVIPVIDLKGGVVVRAQRGERATYRPIETPLSPTSEAVDVIAGLLSLHPFRRLYVADLDAIEGHGDSTIVLDRIGQAFPGLNPWLDNGCCDASVARALLARRPEVSLVLGSESQKDATLLQAFSRHPRVFLSLDFRDETFLGPDALLADPNLWPGRVIVMTLGRVGSGAGPDLRRLEAIRKRAGARGVYAAGGLRGPEDLETLAANGAAGVLVASALHDGRLSHADLAAFST